VKVGGGLLARPDSFHAVLQTIAAGAGRQSLVVVPGGGPFADAVREVDRRVGVPDRAAHWMAVLGMDQYAWLIAACLSGARLVTGPSEIAQASDAGQLPVLAPYRWLREVDPLPHSWDVTSDSIAAWIAGALGAVRLVLVKPPGAAGLDLVDPHFARARPPGLEVDVVPADRLASALLQPA